MGLSSSIWDKIEQNERNMMKKLELVNKRAVDLENVPEEGPSEDELSISKSESGASSRRSKQEITSARRRDFYEGGSSTDVQTMTQR